MDIRDEILDAVIKEIVGPSCNAEYRDELTGEEILLASVHGSPKARYGAGMLYPQQCINREINDSDSDAAASIPDEQNNIPDIEKSKRSNSNTETGGIDEEPVGLANQYLPSAMGFTIRFNSRELDDIISLQISSANYQKGTNKKPKKQISKEGIITTPQNKDGDTFDSDYWIRRPINPDPYSFKINSIFLDGKKSHDVVIKSTEKNDPWLKLRIFNRTTSRDKEGHFLIYTFVLINELKSTTDDAINGNKILFQNELILTTTNENLIAPYNEKNLASDTAEEKELNLLYRKKRVFSIGHGTSVTWEKKQNTITGYETVSKVKTSVIPVYDLPQVAPTEHVDLSMLELSDRGSWEDAKKSLELLDKKYSEWIEKIGDEADNSPELEKYKETAKANVAKCKISLNRIKKGIQILVNSEEDSEAVKCFRWMNRAMIWQQQRSKVKIRKWIKKGINDNQHLILEGINGNSHSSSFSSLEEFHSQSKYNGRWRPFQLAFILMNLESIVNPTSKEREIVDLIWFPTGGGKTEAYLGLTAFTIFFRRIRGKVNWNWDYYGGTTVLMRYTLRLLTTQQFERAASLICACDVIRKENQMELGDEPISIGLWVGSGNTPNKNDEAQAQFNLLKKDPKAEYNFVIMKCPCCGSQIGKVENVGKFDKAAKIKGLFKEDGTDGKIRFKCENTYCEYSVIPLPLLVVDDLIYDNPPTLLLGTVDKFAMIPWKPEACSLFGFRKDNNNWTRICPPELIIQDELHLIAGPLGTMVGLYETMVQTLCNDYKKTNPPFITSEKNSLIPPKIIASSATISRAFEQVKSLYGIVSPEQLSIFPAQGLTFGDTWFSEEKSLDRDEKGIQKFPGRKYIGVLASGFPSAQTSIVRTYAAVLQKVKELAQGDNSEAAMNYYWTLLGFFNSIRELGGASSLVYGDIRERLGQIQSRDLRLSDQRRYINKIEELTSRVSSSEIPSILKKLEASFSSIKNEALDICLATNMVATGVDISRLGLMFIHGQPKTTAEYIQASSRVGREVPAGPGIIFTLYSPSKPRDKSQYEQFQGYHSRIYSNVEPTSVTPFSISAREKALHAVLIGLIRNFSSGELKNSPVINSEFFELIKIFTEIIKDRCEVIDPEEVQNTLKLLEKRTKFWEKGFQSYGDGYNSQIKRDDEYFPLMYATSAEVREEIIREKRSLATSTSMRGVDTESVLSIYSNNDQDVK